MNNSNWFNTLLIVIVACLKVTILLGQEFKDLNHEELSDNLYEKTKTIDSLKNIVNNLNKELKISKSQLSTIRNEQKQIKDINNNLKNEIDLRNKKIEYYELKIDSLSGKLEVQQNESQLYNDISTGCIDFLYEYRNTLGLNPPAVTPIGWSKDGKFAYRVEYCNGGCGCCSESIIVYDTKQSKAIMNYNFDINDMENIMYYDDLYKKLKYIIDTYKIIPLGSYMYFRFKDPIINKTTTRTKIFDDSSMDMEYVEKEQLVYSFEEKYSVELKSDYSTYQLKISKDGINILNNNGKLNENYIPTIPGNVDIAGYIKSPYNDSVYLIALMFFASGFEGESDYYVEFVGFNK
jgi:hypothetical protein